ncbi:MAG TPA: glycosyltransferase [Gemmatimonadales bacterium]|nr:glycosyltransferase [Gemmatimonadales bacterium]
MSGALWFVVESGTDVRLVEGLARRARVSVLARRIPGGVEISQAPSTAVPTIIGPGSRAAFAGLVWRALRRLPPTDRVLVQGYGPAAFAANLAARTSRTPTFMLVCSPVERYYACRRTPGGAGRSRFADKPFRRRELLALNAVARLNARLGRHYIVLSEHLGQVVRSHGGAARVSVVPVYGVDLNVFQPAQESREVLRRERRLPLSGRLVFFSSRVAPEKDAETMLAATRRLLDAGRDLWLLHRSGGYQTFLAAARQAGVEARVVASDAAHPHQGLAQDYQASDLCVQASREEGLGFSPLEALACEVPVVASAVGGLRETVVDGATGWTYPPGDAAALARAMAEALDHPEEAGARARNGRLMVRERYETGRVFSRLMDVLEAG